MSKHEIRMRRQRLTAHGSERFRNYGAILQQHEREKRIRKIMKVFTYLIIILILVMLIFIVMSIERKATTGNKSTFTTLLLRSESQPNPIPPSSLLTPESPSGFD